MIIHSRIVDELPQCLNSSKSDKKFAFIWHGFCKIILHSLYMLQSTRWHQQVKVGHYGHY